MRLRHDGWMLAVSLLLAPLIWFVFNHTALDQAMIAPYYDAHSRSFPWRSDPFMQTVMHDGLKMIVVAVGVVVFGGFVLTYIIPQWRHHRRPLIWMLVAIAGSTELVSLLKHVSGMHCPWDLAEYGGYAPFERLFEHMPVTGGGRCFPGGHASGGFSLMAFYFGLRHVHARRAQIGLVVALALGMAMGWAQMIRGAHFLSHNVWSAWVVWTFMAMLYHLCPPHVARPSTPEDAEFNGS
ncbi:membrane-associated PAP2 superfamily phosphatase [Paucimonas lemoignei]|uniref:Membrane-associated PAP2 superfamily phosphatase n=1 Tax=Paucimonas lemoignei TaxID=29443 RepID=A0A4R3HXR7_PAULE|nr:phosphatase PAP2 family protein [Paucimonas lemoignei]TCS37968.1 membrane-associated PAP2 superfamily phosphatase [Paucimonas lemoignei]